MQKWTPLPDSLFNSCTPVFLSHLYPCFLFLIKYLPPIHLIKNAFFRSIRRLRNLNLFNNRVVIGTFKHFYKQIASPSYNFSIYIIHLPTIAE